MCYVKRSLSYRLFYVLPVLVTWLIMLTVVYSMTYYYLLDGLLTIRKLIFSGLFYFLAFMTALCHTVSMVIDPGEVNQERLSASYKAERQGNGELRLEPKEANQKSISNKDRNSIISKLYNSYCTRCKADRPERTHHCRVCDRCVLKMDHHCPWIANCVGFYNQKAFILFLLYATLGNLVAFISLMPKAYESLLGIMYDPEQYIEGITLEPDQYEVIQALIILWDPLLSLLGAILSFSMTIAIGILLYYQALRLLRNTTGIEELDYQDYRYSPWYMVDQRLAVESVMGTNRIEWLMPWFSPNVYNNGYSYYIPKRKKLDPVHKQS